MTHDTVRTVTDSARATGLTAADLLARYDDALDARRAAELSGDARVIREADAAAAFAWAVAYHARLA